MVARARGLKSRVGLRRLAVPAACRARRRWRSPHSAPPAWQMGLLRGRGVVYELTPARRRPRRRSVEAPRARRHRSTAQPPHARDRCRRHTRRVPKPQSEAPARARSVPCTCRRGVAHRRIFHRPCRKGLDTHIGSALSKTGLLICHTYSIHMHTYSIHLRTYHTYAHINPLVSRGGHTPPGRKRARPARACDGASGPQCTWTP